MDSNNNPTTPRPGSESLNERLRRAAEMARRNMAPENAPASQPSYQQPQQQPRPQPQPQQPQQPQQPRQPRPEPRQYPEPQTPRQPEQPQQRSYEPEPHTPRQQAGAATPDASPRLSPQETAGKTANPPGRGTEEIEEDDAHHRYPRRVAWSGHPRRGIVVSQKLLRDGGPAATD